MLHLYRLLATAALLLAALSGTPVTAQATFTVNTTADPGDGTCDAAECTLREAIAAANAAPGADHIHFAIPGAGVHTIQPATDLPALVGPATLDGYTQPGASPNTLAIGNDAVLRIELSGTGSGRGLTLAGTGAVARGLVVNGFGWNGGGGIVTQEGADHVIAGNFVGTDPTGTLDLGNIEGIVVFRSTGVRVGGTDPADRNVISGNGTGVVVSDAPSNVIEGNYIGTTADGTAALGNSSHGIGIGGAWGGSNGNRVGGTEPDAGNVISGNDTGVSITGDWSNVVQGNRIGTNAAGTAAIPNQTGIGVGGNPGAYNLLIGGLEPGAGNVISGNTGRGVSIGDPHIALVTVQGNLIGVAEDGVSPLGNGEAGVHIGFSIGGGGSGGGPAVIGGGEPGAGNVIAYNGGNGITVICCEGRPSTFSANAIFANGGAGIDIGATENDPGDADAGTNRLQNFPEVVASGLSGAGPLVVTYFVDTDPAHATYPLRVEFFRARDGEGEAFLGADAYSEADYSGCGSPPCQKVAAFVPTVPVADADSVVATATDAEGNTSEFTALPAIVVATEPSPAGVPAAPTLGEPYPNPFSYHVRVSYDLSMGGTVRLVVYDILGREAAVLVDGEHPAGRYEAALDGRGLAAGTYLVRMTAAGGFTQTRTAILLR